MLLSKEQEKTLFDRLSVGDEKAQQEIIEANFFLVEKIAEKYAKKYQGLSFENLKEIGKRGLEKAVKKFKSTEKFKFSTYATWWIREEIHKKLGIR